jgi:hypothetical protein
VGAAESGWVNRLELAPERAILPADPVEHSMSERRFVLLDFTHMSRAGFLRLYEAGRLYTLPRAIAHAASKRELVAREQPAHWVRPSMFRAPELLTEAEVVEAEAELRALQRHALELVDPRVGN